MSRKILLADDSVTIQKVVELTFMDEDVEVVTVGDGAEALERLDEVDPDLLIADVHMPGADGYEVCRESKSRRPGTPVLLLVGTFEPFDEAEARNAGADAFLKKPFDSQDLLQQVEDLLAAAGDETTGRVAEAPGFDDADEEDSLPAPTPEAFGQLETRPRAVIDAAPTPARAAAPAPAAAAAEVGGGGGNGSGLDDAAVDRIARRVVEMLGDTVLREVAWEVVPDLAEVVIKERIRELESQVE